MATADIEEHHSERDHGYTLFSKQYFGQLIIKIVRIDSVVQKFINCKAITADERTSLSSKKIADQKLKHLLSIINENCNTNDLRAFKVFIDILGETGNGNVAQHLSVIYNEREHYVATLNLLSKEKSLVKDLENEIINFQRKLDTLLERNKTLMKENKSLAEQTKETEKELFLAEKEIGELTRTITYLKNEVEHKSNVIRKREKEIAEKERKVWEAIQESNDLLFKFDKLDQQHSETMVKDKKMSKKIEILENEIDEKEKTIMNLRNNRTVTLEELEEELGKITKVQEKKLDDQTAMIKQQNEKFDDQTAMMKQQNQKIDILTDAVTRALNLPENK